MTSASGGAAPDIGTSRLVGASRSLAIDRYRGALVLLMVAGNFSAPVRAVPDFLKHAPDIGLTVADLVAPAFVFVIALNYGPSFARRARAGRARAYRHFVLRYLGFIAIGEVLSIGGTLVANEPSDWGVLQALGTAGLLCLPVISLGTAARLLIGVGLLVAYQLALDAWLLPSVLGSIHGGFFGAFSWGAMLILATVVADVWRMGRIRYVQACLALIVAAAVMVWAVPVSKNRVSLSYVLLTLAIAAVAFLLAEAGSRLAARPGFLCWWGENPLALYLLHLLVLALFVLPPADWWHDGAPFWMAVVQLAAIIAGLSVAAWWLHHNPVRLRDDHATAATR